MANMILKFEFNSSIEKVWEALTHSDTLAKWVMENNFRPIVGYKCQFYNKKIGLTVNSEVLIVDKPYKLSYTWVGGPINTIVTWTLRQEGNTTYVHLEQTGFVEENQEYNGAKYGWTFMLEKLNELIR
ncbi:SRPBCC family protein [Alkalicoccobacillus porphyridii]|uniref:SRPBCC domain-containing protein n=1 Tax=Alkalicoccobacillus porphyridii TaxID=2597270 RepID=A0A553ZVR1_9BACI|nr:SRPBCC domain-containing protein [Alkalicoccobacillus porphyridii]TSB45425.1 SRPBCC domain-containing protein [Alkalicoccobacillus porphyridii]